MSRTIDTIKADLRAGKPPQEGDYAIVQASENHGNAKVWEGHEAVRFALRADFSLAHAHRAMKATQAARKWEGNSGQIYVDAPIFLRTLASYRVRSPRPKLSPEQKQALAHARSRRDAALLEMRNAKAWVKTDPMCRMLGGLAPSKVRLMTATQQYHAAQDRVRKISAGG